MHSFYNKDGLRVRKTATSTGTTNYTLHGKNIVHLVNGKNSMHFFYDARNRPAVVTYNGIDYAYIYNVQGDVIALVDSTGSKVVEYYYDAWGKILSVTGTLATTLGVLNPFRYRGYVFDEETGLYYLRSRYYNLNWDRFINADRLIKGNLYCYCGNKPINREDPTGNESQWMANRISQPAIANAFENLAWYTRLKHIGGSSYQALRTIEENNETIINAAQKQQIPVALLQSVIFREQICLGIEDPVADFVFSNILGDYRTSTGLAQIKPATAIRAEKTVLGSSAHTNESMYFALQNDETNIMYAAMVLKMEALASGYDTTAMNREQMQHVLTRYNGDPSYGSATIEYYDAFALALELD